MEERMLKRQTTSKKKKKEKPVETVVLSDDEEQVELKCPIKEEIQTEDVFVVTPIGLQGNLKTEVKEEKSEEAEDDVGAAGPSANKPKPVTETNVIDLCGENEETPLDKSLKHFCKPSSTETTTNKTVPVFKMSKHKVRNIFAIIPTTSGSSKTPQIVKRSTSPTPIMVAPAPGSRKPPQIAMKKTLLPVDQAKMDAHAIKPIKRPTPAPPATVGSKKSKPSGGTSVAKDPHKSDVYKSLFTSHASEQQQKRAHWVTYNPFYN